LGCHGCISLTELRAGCAAGGLSLIDPGFRIPTPVGEISEAGEFRGGQIRHRPGRFAGGLSFRQLVALGGDTRVRLGGVRFGLRQLGPGLRQAGCEVCALEFDQNIAGPYFLVFSDVDLCDIALNPGGDATDVGADLRIFSGDQKTSVQDPVDPKPCQAGGEAAGQAEKQLAPEAAATCCSCRQGGGRARRRPGRPPRMLAADPDLF
jgi:hypothetical protein